MNSVFKAIEIIKNSVFKTIIIKLICNIFIDLIQHTNRVTVTKNMQIGE